MFVSFPNPDLVQYGFVIEHELVMKNLLKCYRGEIFSLWTICHRRTHRHQAMGNSKVSLNRANAYVVHAPLIGMRVFACTGKARLVLTGSTTRSRLDRLAPCDISIPRRQYPRAATSYLTRDQSVTYATGYITYLPTCWLPNEDRPPCERQWAFLAFQLPFVVRRWFFDGNLKNLWNSGSLDIHFFETYRILRQCVHQNILPLNL